MARIPMVTRTLTSTKASILLVNVGEDSTYVEEVIVPRTYKSEEKLLKVIRELRETDNEKVVAVKSSETISNLYGMTEDTFMEHAEIIPNKKEEA